MQDDRLPSWQADEIAPGSFMGGTANEEDVMVPGQRTGFDDPKHYDAVVTLYAWARPVGWEVPRWPGC